MAPLHHSISLQTSDPPSGLSDDGTENHEPERLTPRKPVSWATVGAEPVQLKRSVLVLLTSLVLLIAPFLFIALTIASAVLDGSQISDFGRRLEAALQLAPTLFPIVFAAVCGHFMTSIALVKSQTGLKMKLLEHLVGAQSMFSSIERFIFLRNFNFMGSLIVLVWLLSPLGGQALLRLINTENHSSVETASICYLNQSDIGLLGNNAAAGNVLGDTSINLYLLSILSASQTLRSPMDSWNNVKIPARHSLAGELGTEWVKVREDNDVFSSLIGIPVGDIPAASSESNFVIPTEYMEFDCWASNISSLEDFAASLPAQLQNVEQPYNDVNLFPDNATQFLYNDEDSYFTFYDDTANGLRVYYSSRTPNGQSFTYCNMTPISVEANVTCSGTDCSVNAMREGSYILDPSQIGFIFSLLGNRLWIEVGLTANGFQSSRTEYFLFDPTASVGSLGGYIDITTVPLDELSRRLTTAFNSFYVATGSPLTIAGGYDCNQWAATEDTYAINDATVIHDAGRYYVVNKAWLAIAFVITILLEIMAAVTFALTFRIKVPDIFGYASSLLFDNQYCRERGIALSTALDGSDRAAKVGDIKFMLADIGSEKEDVGKIAFVPLLADNDDDDDEGKTDPGPIRTNEMTRGTRMVKLKRWYE